MYKNQVKLKENEIITSTNEEITEMNFDYPRGGAEDIRDKKWKSTRDNFTTIRWVIA